MEHVGSCLCKAVKYKIEGDFENFYLCHCKYCRKDSGSAHAANLFSTTAKIEWIQGKNKVTTFLLPKTNHVKAFCSTCGSALPNLQMEGKLLVVPAGSLDSKLNKTPDGHIFISNKANWDDSLENIKKFQKFPDEK